MILRRTKLYEIFPIRYVTKNVKIFILILSRQNVSKYVRLSWLRLLEIYEIVKILWNFPIAMSRNGLSEHEKTWPSEDPSLNYEQVENWTLKFNINVYYLFEMIFWNFRYSFNIDDRQRNEILIKKFSANNRVFGIYKVGCSGFENYGKYNLVESNFRALYFHSMQPVGLKHVITSFGQRLRNVHQHRNMTPWYRLWRNPI